MERSRVTRYLRIAVTALCLTVCVLLVALWVRSYWRMDWASSWLTSNRFVKGSSYLGSIALEHTAAPRTEADIHTVGWVA